MASHINGILKQALCTFGGAKDLFSHNLAALRDLLDKLSANDVGFKGHELLKIESWKRPGKAPVSYIDIYEDDRISIGVFVLRPGMKLPLHNHPHMHGLIKVISGSIKISAYTICKVNAGDTVEVEPHDPIKLSHLDPSCMLEPERGNLHEIENLEEAAAFVDILAPPYDTFMPGIGQRKCSYFKPIQQIGPNRLLLKTVDSPSWFWSDTYPYLGPKISEDELLRIEHEGGRGKGSGH